MACSAQTKLVEALQPMSNVLVVILTAMTPIGELRAAIPLALIKYDMAWPLAFFLGIVGNLIPIPFILIALRSVGDRLERRDDVIGRVLRWRTEQIQRRWGAAVARNAFWAVMTLVAIPLPFTGAWTGALAVWALRVRTRTGLAAIAGGVVIAGVIVTALAQAGVSILGIHA